MHSLMTDVFIAKIYEKLGDTKAKEWSLLYLYSHKPCCYTGI